MTTSRQNLRFSQTAIALAVLGAFSPVQGQDIADLTAPGNSISVGVGVASGDEKDRARFGMFNGLRTQGATACWASAISTATRRRASGSRWRGAIWALTTGKWVSPTASLAI